MIEIEEMVPYYICNKEPTCNISVICGDDCKHTMCELYAKNKDSIDIFKAFANRFVCIVDDDGRLHVSEKEE